MSKDTAGYNIERSSVSIALSHHCTLKDAEETLSLLLDEGQEDKPDMDDKTTSELTDLLHRIRTAIAKAEKPL